MYSVSVIFPLVGMIVVGAARSVVIKIYFQLQEEMGRAATPMFVTLLYLFAHAISLFVYVVERKLVRKAYYDNLYSTIDGSDPTADASDNCDDRNSNTQSISEGNNDSPISISNDLGYHDDYNDDDNDNEVFVDEEEMISSSSGSRQLPIDAVVIRNGERPTRLLRKQGSSTGLTSDSGDAFAVAWIRSIPWYLKPAIPGLFNLCCTALRWASLVYVAASVAEILIGGMELVFSSFAARIIRKRLISPRRWIGVAFVTLGILGVGFAKTRDSSLSSSLDSEEKDGEAAQQQHEFVMGNLLIFGQCLFSVFQDLSEEIILQEAEYPATLLLGLEGLFGLAFGIPVYVLFFKEDDLELTRFNVVWGIGIVVVVLGTGLFNLYATEVTSSMTRNVWRQFRIALVWIMGLSVYYLGSDLGIGEPWTNPSSLFVLTGFSVIMVGVYFYYSDHQ